MFWGGGGGGRGGGGNGFYNMLSVEQACLDIVFIYGKGSSHDYV